MLYLKTKIISEFSLLNIDETILYLACLFEHLILKMIINNQDIVVIINFDGLGEVNSCNRKFDLNVDHIPV